MAMLNVDTSLVIAAIVGATTGAAVSVHLFSLKAHRRARELRTANKAMRVYYTLLDEIVDDPALPDDAAEFLAVFADILPDQNGCSSFSSGVMKSKGNGSKDRGNRMFDLIEGLGKTRPDLRDKFHRAIANGIVAVFHRWPGNSWKFAQMMQEIASDKKKEFQFVSRLENSRHHEHHGPHALAV